MFSKGELSKILQSTQEIYLETNVNNVHNSPTNMDIFSRILHFILEVIFSGNIAPDVKNNTLI
jgi:hypothetical protein